MSTSTPFDQVYTAVISKQDYSLLDPYIESAVYEALSSSHRELLALALIARGETELDASDPDVTETFALASKVAPKSLKQWIRQGEVFARHDKNIRCLVLACKAFEKASKIDSKRSSIFASWGATLIKVGLYHNEASHFRDADACFVKAEHCADPDVDHEMLNDMYWHWGQACYYAGKESGEAMDFRSAVEKYQRAADLGLNKAVFWNDYGNALVDLACLIRRHELLYDAAQLYAQATQECEDYFPAWLNLACCYQELYHISSAEDFFVLADEAFQHCADFGEDDIGMWVKWGILYVHSGKIEHDVERLWAGIEKFEKADASEPDHALVLEQWAEAEVLIGGYTERLDLLKKSEERILQSLALQSDSVNGWYVLGSCLLEQGHYFSDEEYYHQAIDRFQYGLTKDPADHRILHGVAVAYMQLADLRGDFQVMEKALAGYEEAGKLEDAGSIQFWNDWGTALMKMTEMTGSGLFLEEALQKFEHAIALMGGEEDTTLVDPALLYNYGCALDFFGDFSDKEDHYQRSIDVLSQLILLEPDYSHAKYNLALAWSHLGELTSDLECFDQAIEQFQASAQLDPEDEMVWNDWGLAQLNMAQLMQDPSHEEQVGTMMQEVEAKFLHASALGSMAVFYNLACFYSLQRQEGPALHYLEKARSSGMMPSLDDVLHDEWMEYLRQTQSFKEYYERLVNKVEE